MAVGKLGVEARAVGRQKHGWRKITGLSSFRRMSLSNALTWIAFGSHPLVVEEIGSLVDQLRHTRFHIPKRHARKFITNRVIISFSSVPDSAIKIVMATKVLSSMRFSPLWR